nr:SWF/SNF helicase family protein [bacterium]
VIIFTEFATTARYLETELKSAGIDNLAQIDGSVSRGGREDVIERFSPYYNDSSKAELARKKQSEIRVLISTDVLSEGLNLQDATLLINYDIHWNPVRLMQRIGRVDRRINEDIEAQLVEDFPDRAPLRGIIRYWNFLPPGELEALLLLYQRVTHKTIRISATFGVEGGKLYHPEDQYDDVKILQDFNETLEGKESLLEEMKLELERLLLGEPDLERRLAAFPSKVFSGKTALTPGTKAVFFCFALPGRKSSEDKGELFDTRDEWKIEAGQTAWYLYDIATGSIIEGKGGEKAMRMLNEIRSTPDTPRATEQPRARLSEIRAELEKHIKNSYLKKMQAPVGVKAQLRAWTELT